MCRKFFAVAAALGLCLAHVPATRADDNTVQLGQIVVTDTGTATPLQTLPGNTVRVDARTLELIGATHPAQIFTVVPGAWATQGSGQESLLAIRSPLLTGRGACGAFLLLEDGIPIQPAGFCNVNALFWLNIEQASAVEVIRGPGSVLYGSNALNGIVNVLTEPADFAPLKSANLERGANHYLRAAVSLGEWNGSDGLRIAANATHDGGFRADSGYDQQKFDLRLDHDDGRVRRETLFAGTNLNQRTASYIYGLSAYKNEALRDSNPTPGAFREAQSWLAAQKWQAWLANGAELDFTPYLRRNSTAFTEHFLPGTPIESDAANSLGTLLALRISPDADTRIIYGLDGEYAHGTVQEFQPATITHLPPAQADIRPAGLHYDYAADSRTLAAYLHVTHAWSPRWLFSGGLRLEGVRYSYVNFLPVGNTRADGSACPFGGCLFNRPADRRDRFVNLLPKFGVSYLESATQTFYVNLGRGARAPQTTELYELQRGQNVADLNSETLNSFEFGWRGYSGPWTWDTDTYYMLKNHFIFRDSNGFNVSNGRIRSQGVEFSLRYRMSEAWEWLADGSYALHRYVFSANLGQGNFIAYGNDVKYAPRSLGDLRLRWRPARSWNCNGLTWAATGWTNPTATATAVRIY